MLCVVTSDERLNALSGATADSARVIITTQQMLERRVTNGTFNAFTFQGEPRAVRVWDEAWLPGHPVTLSVDDVAFVLRRLSLSAELRSDVLSIFNDVEKLATGATYAVPDFADKHSTITLNDALGTTEGGGSDADATKFRDDERAAISSLWYVSGKTVTIRRDGRFGNAVLDFKQTLPDDLAPMVILDASGRVRQTYVDLAATGRLLRLLSAPKRYDQLTVHVWRTGGGKPSFADNGAKLTAGIAKTIDTRPTENQEYVETWTKGAKAGDVLPFKLIQRDVGIDRWTFRENVRPPLIDALAEMGVV